MVSFKILASYFLFLPLIFSLNLPEDLNVTTRLDFSIITLPVTGFLPLRLLFSLTQNLPNPLIMTSSPDPSVFLLDIYGISL